MIALRGKDVVALIAGATFTFALSPFDYWPFALLSPAALFWVVQDCSIQRCVARFYAYNLGLFGAGVSWIYVSIHEFGGASMLLAGALVFAFVASYALVSLVQGYLFGRWFRAAGLPLVLGFSALWVLQEWFRSWFLTGFPWMFLGYGLMGTWFENLAPYLGVFGVSFVGVLSVCFGVYALQHRYWRLLLAPLAMLVIAFTAGLSDFTRPGQTLTVSLVQGNVDQRVKWHPESRVPIMQLYADASRDEWGRDLIVWPEAAITSFPQHAAQYLGQMEQQARLGDSTLVLGIPDRNEAGGFANTVIALGKSDGRYIKRRLVPFGEYVPLENWLRGLITFFDLPMSRNQPGPEQQIPMTIGEHAVSVSICYEVVYPELVRTTARDPGLLLTVSNDSWFGASIGPWQHLQMARMRALENGRYMVRATNNGVTAVINHRGEIVADMPQFEMGVLRSELEIRAGVTPFHQFGSYPVLLLSFGLLAGLLGYTLRANSGTGSQGQ